MHPPLDVPQLRRQVHPRRLRRDAPFEIAVGRHGRHFAPGSPEASIGVGRGLAVSLVDVEHVLRRTEAAEWFARCRFPGLRIASANDRHQDRNTFSPLRTNDSSCATPESLRHVLSDADWRQRDVMPEHREPRAMVARQRGELVAGLHPDGARVSRASVVIRLSASAVIGVLLANGLFAVAANQRNRKPVGRDTMALPSTRRHRSVPHRACQRSGVLARSDAAVSAAV